MLVSLSPIILGNSGSPLSSKSNSMPSPGLKPGKTYLVSAWVAASGRSDGTGRVVGARDRLLLLHNLRHALSVVLLKVSLTSDFSE